MIQTDWLDRGIFDISTAEQAEAALRQIDEAVLVMVKRIQIYFQDLQEALGVKLQAKFKNIAKAISNSFRIRSVEDFMEGAAIYSEALAGSLGQLQLELTGLQIAVIQAVAPFVQLLLPVVRTAVQALTGLVGALGQVLQILLLGEEGAQNFADSLASAATTGNTLKRTVAGFDQLNRLGSQNGKSVLGSYSWKPLSDNWKKLADSILEYLEPLRKLDLTPAAQSLERLKKALTPITRELFGGLEWAWNNLFVPLAKWTVEEVLPVFIDTLRSGLEALGVVIDALKPTFTWLWENFLQPLARWAGDQVIAYLQGIADELNGVLTQVGNSENIVQMAINAGTILAKTIASIVSETIYWDSVTQKTNLSLGDMLSSLLGITTPLGTASQSVGGLISMVGKLAEAFGLVDESSNSVWNGIKTIWSGAWQWLKTQLVDPAYSGLRASINSVIGFLNAMLQGAANAVNFLSEAISKVGFDIPDWVPVVGGKGVHFQIGTVTAPQIPYLAKGAVLPANKPFMAVVGDQKYGTNVEAPLTTIQEAVALVMRDFAQSNLAGHEATVSVLREILEAVLGIELTDSVIASAVDRHQHQLAMVKGG